MTDRRIAAPSKISSFDEYDEEVAGMSNPQEARKGVSSDADAERRGKMQFAKPMSGRKGMPSYEDRYGEMAEEGSSDSEWRSFALSEDGVTRALARAGSANLPSEIIAGEQHQRNDDDDEVMEDGKLGERVVKVDIEDEERDESKWKTGVFNDLFATQKIRAHIPADAPDASVAGGDPNRSILRRPSDFTEEGVPSAMRSRRLSLSEDQKLGRGTSGRLSVPGSNASFRSRVHSAAGSLNDEDEDEDERRIEEQLRLMELDQGGGEDEDERKMPSGVEVEDPREHRDARSDDLPDYDEEEFERRHAEAAAAAAVTSLPPVVSTPPAARGQAAAASGSANARRGRITLDELEGRSNSGKSRQGSQPDARRPGAYSVVPGGPAEGVRRSTAAGLPGPGDESIAQSPPPQDRGALPQSQRVGNPIEISQPLPPPPPPPQMSPPTGRRRPSVSSHSSRHSRHGAVNDRGIPLVIGGYDEPDGGPPLEVFGGGGSGGGVGSVGGRYDDDFSHRSGSQRGGGSHRGGSYRSGGERSFRRPMSVHAGDAHVEPVLDRRSSRGPPVETIVGRPIVEDDRRRNNSRSDRSFYSTGGRSNRRSYDDGLRSLPARHRGAPQFEAPQYVEGDPGVTFGKVYIRWYARQLGDNPSCSSGPPISIGWDYDPNMDVIDVSEFEGIRGRRRSEAEMAIPRPIREKMLMEWGVKKSEMVVAIRQSIKAKNQRRRTVHNLGVSGAEELIENAGRRILRALKGKRKEQDEYDRWKREMAALSDDIGTGSDGVSQDSLE